MDISVYTCGDCIPVVSFQAMYEHVLVDVAATLDGKAWEADPVLAHVVALPALGFDQGRATSSRHGFKLLEFS